MSENVKVVEALELFCQAMDNAVQVLRQELAKAKSDQAQSSFPELSFDILKWEASKGEKLGEFEVATKISNLPDKWNHAFNILKANNATINNHFAPEGFLYYYWLYLEKYEGKIFRKKKAQEVPKS